MKRLNIFLLIIFTMCSCAQFVPPTGGPKDITPPKLLESNPKNGTTNFHGQTLNFAFNELIEATALKQELIVVPELVGNYNIKTKNKNLQLILENPLKENTTYTFNFRKGIKDLTEKNALKDFKIVLSTGPQIDSIQIKGNVQDIHTKKAILDATVGLYLPNDTVLLGTKKPQYFTKTDSSGNYLFENIKSNTYKILAFTDKNTNLILNTKTESYGFLKEEIILKTNITLPTIELYKADRTKNKIKKTISRYNNFVIYLDKPAIKIIPLDTPTHISYILNNNTITAYNLDNKIDHDTLNTKIIILDSLLNADTLKTKIYFNKAIKNQKKSESIININSNIKPQSIQSLPIKYVFTFDSPIISTDSTKIIYLEDTLRKPLQNITWLNSHTLQIVSSIKAKKSLEIRFLNHCFTNYKLDTNAIYTIKNTIISAEETGSVSGKINKFNTITKIAQLINSTDNSITQQIIFKTNYSVTHIIPGNYFIKVIIDENNNGIWDAGNIKTNQMPEPVLINKEYLKIKANFNINNYEIK